MPHFADLLVIIGSWHKAVAMIVKHDQIDIQQTILLELSQKSQQSLIVGLQRLWTVQILLLIPEQNVSHMPTSVHAACKHTAALPIGSSVHARPSCADVHMQVVSKPLNFCGTLCRCVY